MSVNIGELAAPIIRPDTPTFEGAVTRERVQKFWARPSKARAQGRAAHYTANIAQDRQHMSQASRSCRRLEPKKAGSALGTDLRLQELFETVNMLKSKHDFTEKARVEIYGEQRAMRGRVGAAAEP